MMKNKTTASDPAVSVLIRTKDRPNTFLRAIESVNNQSYKDIEIIVINDGGIEIKDDVINSILEERSDSIEYKLINLKDNIGRSAAANKAMENASGDYFIFLDDDDWFSEHHIEKLISNLSEMKGYIAAYSDTACVKSFEEKEKILRIYSEPFSKKTLAAINYLPIHAVLFNRAIFDYGCRFDTELNIFEDWHFWIQAVNHGEFYHSPGITAFYSGEVSGIGFFGNDKDYLTENAYFFKKAIPFLSPDQIASLQYGYREFYNIAAHNSKLEDDINNIESTNHLIESKSSEIHDITKSIINIIENEYPKTLTNETYLLKELILEILKKESEKTKEEIKLLLEETIKNTNENQEKIRLDITQELREIKNTIWSINTKTDEINKKLFNNKIYSFLKKIPSKSKTLAKLIIKKDIETIKEKISYNFPLLKNIAKSIWLSNSKKKENYNKEEKNNNIDKKETQHNNSVFTIVTPKHTLFVAELIKKNIARYNISIDNILDCSTEKFNDNVHIVIAPQMCKSLPNNYISFQMEQSVSSRWFTERYFNILENSIAIMDYSKSNIEYIQENSNISYKQLFFSPISNISGYFDKKYDIEKEYDVVFYGDINNERRKEFLDAISNKYKTLIVSEVFGEELYEKILKAKILVNIHYYEGALLETTRIYEAISIGMPIVTESSSDIDEHSTIKAYASITPIGDIESMLDSIGEILNNYSDYCTSVGVNTLEDDSQNFAFYLGRMLLGSGFLKESASMSFPSPITKQEMQQGVGLSLPESWERNQEFIVDFPDTPFFPGLRHKDSWKGCALSYKYLASQAIGYQLKHLEIMEDDVLLTNENKELWEKAKTVFHNIEYTDQHCDLLSGVLADVSNETRIIDVFTIDGQEYSIIDRMISAVCNYYGEYPLQLMSKWDPENNDIASNTMDRYLENAKFRVMVPLPFIAGHKPEKVSTIWNFNNDTYSDMIENSEKILINKVNKFKRDNRQ